jgi:hypothetical protein
VQSLRDDARNIGWEPRGVWEEQAAAELAEQLDMRLVRDLSREDRLDDDPIVYTRLRALGEGARIGAAAAERLAERLEGVSEANVVVEGAGAGRVRALLREVLGATHEESGDDNPPFDDEAEADAHFDDELGPAEEDE